MFLKTDLAMIMKKYNKWEVVRLAGIFIPFFLFVWLRIDTALIYHSLGMLNQGRGITALPTFYGGWSFFSESADAVGGIVEYISAFLYQYYFYPSTGALIATVVALAIYLAISRIISCKSESRFAIASCIPVLLIFAIFCEYTLCLAVCVGLSLSLLAVLIYLAIINRPTLIKVPVLVVSCTVLYYFGGGTSLIYPLFCAALEFRSQKRLLPGLAYLLVAIAIPYIVGTVCSNLSMANAYTILLPFHPESYCNQSLVARALVVFFPVLAMVLAIQKPAAAWVRRLFLKRSASNETTTVQYPAKYQRTTKAVMILEVLAIIIAGSSVVYFRCDQGLQTALRINSYSRQKMWTQALQEASRLPEGSYHMLIGHDICSALYHNGRLPYDLFAYTQVYPQSAKALLEMNFGFSGEISDGFSMAELSRLADLYYDLGLINSAELASYVNLEINEHPSILKQLFYINTAKGNTEAAGVYLRALGKSPVLGKWAIEQLRQSQEDPLKATDEQMAEIRSYIPVNDFIHDADTEAILLDLLEHNRYNRMAFEYLMTYYLLSIEQEKAAECIHRLDDFDYPTMPPLYEEAMVMCENQTGRKVDLRGKTISAETLEHFVRFRHLYKLYQQNDEKAFRQLVEEFSDSYFFYCVLGRSGKINAE
jgi:Family of unknown function (DUF6057)